MKNLESTFLHLWNNPPASFNSHFREGLSLGDAALVLESKGLYDLYTRQEMEVKIRDLINESEKLTREEFKKIYNLKQLRKDHKEAMRR